MGSFLLHENQVIQSIARGAGAISRSPSRQIGETHDWPGARISVRATSVRKQLLRWHGHRREENGATRTTSQRRRSTVIDDPEREGLYRRYCDQESRNSVLPAHH